VDATTITNNDATLSTPSPAGGALADGFLEVRPRLRHDVLFADMGDGVLFRNSDTGFIVKGRTAYRFVTMLAPHLTGRHTVAELCAGLGESQRAMVTDFVRTLLDREFARDSRPGRSAELPESVLARFHPQVNYVEHYSDDAAYRFARFRAANVLILGSGPISTAAARSLLRNGMRAVHVAAAGVADALTAEAAALRAEGCEAEVRLADHAVENIAAPEAASYDMVIAPVEDTRAAEVLRLGSVRSSAGPALLTAVVVGDLAVVGPLVRAGSAPCWTCALLRLGANLDPRAVGALWRDIGLPGLAPAAGVPSTPVSAMLGNMLGYEVFRVLTECMPAETDGAVVVQDLKTLEISREPLLPHPLCPVCAEVQANARPIIRPEQADTAPAEAAADDEDHDPDRLRAELERHLDLVGAHVGVFTQFADSSIDQSPLKLSRLRVGPAAHLGAGPRVIAAADLHYLPRARTRAVHAAALVYAGQVAYARDAVIANRQTLTGSGRAVIAYERLLTWSGRAVEGRPAEPWLTATSLLSGQEHYVPVAAVHPFSAANADFVSEPSAAGNGVGATVPEAIRTGVLSALAYEALCEAAAGRTVGRPIQVSAPEHGSELDFLIRTAKNMELPVELVDIAPRGPAHLVLARVVAANAAAAQDRVSWAMGAELSRSAAVIAALRDLLAEEQLRRELGPDTTIDFGDPLLPQLDVRAIQCAGTDEVRPDARVPDLFDDIRVRGRDALVVATTTPDLSESGGVVTVRVLLATCQE
jgi:bacteriocin biosynthesis cyclodehydratase domain-containing protein